MRLALLVNTACRSLSTARLSSRCARRIEALRGAAPGAAYLFRTSFLPRLFFKNEYPPIDHWILKTEHGTVNKVTLL